MLRRPFFARLCPGRGSKPSRNLLNLNVYEQPSRRTVHYNTAQAVSAAKRSGSDAANNDQASAGLPGRAPSVLPADAGLASMAWQRLPRSVMQRLVKVASHPRGSRTWGGPSRPISMQISYRTSSRRDDPATSMAKPRAGGRSRVSRLRIAPATDLTGAAWRVPERGDLKARQKEKPAREKPEPAPSSIPIRDARGPDRSS